jgi:phosphate:Na+ symporter
MALLHPSLRPAVLSTILLLSGAVSVARADGSDSSPNGIEETATLIAYMMAGVGIFLVGIKFIASHLQQMTGSTFRSLVLRTTAHPIGSVLWGSVLGFFTQSGKASSFIIAGFVQAGLLPVRRALPVVFWCNAGASLIVVASILPIKLIVMVLLGLTGLGLTFGLPKRLLHSYGALFGIAMIMYGLYLLKTGAGGFMEYPWLPPMLEQMRGVYLLSLLAGTVLTLVAQSDMAVAMIAITMAASGLFGLEESAMIAYGTQAGAGLLTYGFSFNFKGRARQVVVSQVYFKALVTVVCVVLFYIEILAGVPLLLALTRAMTADAGTQVAIITLSFSFVGALLVWTAERQIYRRVAQRHPPSTTELLGEPQYVGGRISDSPDTGLLLVAREQGVLLGRLPMYLDAIREGGDAGRPAELHDAFGSVSATVGAVLADLSSRSLTERHSMELIRLAKLQEQLVNLEDVVFRISSHIGAHVGGESASSLGRAVLESLDFVLLAAVDAQASGDPVDLEALRRMTHDRTEIMDRVRRACLHSAEQLAHADRNFVLDITILFENAVLAMARIAELFDPEASASGTV